eukprot:4831800-Amphidinium_carterae.1
MMNPKAKRVSKLPILLDVTDDNHGLTLGIRRYSSPLPLVTMFPPPDHSTQQTKDKSAKFTSAKQRGTNFCSVGLWENLGCRAFRLLFRVAKAVCRQVITVYV